MATKIDRVSPLLRAFALLEHVVAADAPISLNDATAAAGLPKPTVYRMLATLEEAGLVAREPDGRRVGAGPRLTRLALDVLRNGVTRGPRRAILQQLVGEIAETCNLTMIDGGEVVYLDRVESAWPLRMTLQPGSRVPLHCTASGKLLLALLPPAGASGSSTRCRCRASPIRPSSTGGAHRRACTRPARTTGDGQRGIPRRTGLRRRAGRHRGRPGDRIGRRACPRRAHAAFGRALPCPDLASGRGGHGHDLRDGRHCEVGAAQPGR